MSEVTALSKHPCPGCGGEAVWNPAKQALVCPFCGLVVPGTPPDKDQPIAEHDLAAALANVPDDQRGWQERKISIKCQSCQAISVMDPERVAQRCDFCGSPAIAPYEETRDPIRPESLLPAKLSETAVRDTLRRWDGTRWFAPNRLKTAALTDTLHGVYLPYWTFDARASADWTAESGYYYYEHETYRDAQGKTQTRQVRKIRWQHSSGQLEHFFDDDLVPGTSGVDLALLRQVEPFPTREELVPYAPTYIRGWVVERYQVDLRQAAQHSQEQMEAAVRELCRQEVPGDTHRNLRVDARFLDRTFKHILLPIWLVTYTYGSRHFQVVVNGYTGSLAGNRPYSWLKITGAVLGILLLIAIVALIAGAAQ